MKKKILSYILILSILTSIFAYHVPVLSASSPDTKYIQCSQPELFAGTKADGSDDPKFVSIKSQLPVGTLAINKNGYRFNFRLWHDKGIVVYGTPLDIPFSLRDFDTSTQEMIDGKPVLNDNQGYYNKDLKVGGSVGEYRYHGFDAQGNKYSNINFPNDSTNYSQLQNRTWLYKPWDNTLTPETIRISDYNQSAIDGNTTTQAWIENTIKEINIKEAYGTNGLEIGAEVLSKTRKYDYLHVQSAPTAIMPGEARMWHKTSTSQPFYQTLTVPAISDFKIITPVIAKTEVLSAQKIVDVKSSNENDDIKVPVKVKVTATLDDQAFYTNLVEKVNHYTRDDIQSWDIKLRVDENTVLTPTNVNTMNNIAWATFDVELTQGEIKANGFKWDFLGSGTVTYLDKKQASASHLYTHNFTTETVEAPPILINTHPSIPKDWYDIVKYPASDNTDMTDVTKREVFVNGVSVSDTTFFSGNYIFGDEQVGLNEIAIYWTLKDGKVYESILFTVIHSTIPRAQYKISGSYKQNRKLTFSDYTTSGNDPFVLNTYPINSFTWSFTSLDGDSSAIKRNSVSSTLNELVCKEPGLYRATLIVKNTLGRTSEPYTVTFRILEDYPAAVIFNLNNSVMARNESITSYAYETVSTDGDIVESNSLELWYDSDNNGSYDKLLNTWTNFSEFPSYTPTQLGKYKFVDKVTERFGEPTISEFITEVDKKTITVEREFLVDNYIPMTGLYVDIPIVRPQVDLFFMLDEGFNQVSFKYMIDNRMNIANTMRLSNIIANVQNWDLKTYTYSQAANTTKNTGTSIPPTTITYSSNGYSGTLTRTSYSDNGDYQDFGSYQTRRLSKTASDTASGYSYTEYDSTGAIVDTYSSNIPSISYSDSDGYSGTLSKKSYTLDNTVTTDYADGGKLVERYYTGYYSGTVYKTEQYWVSNYKWVSDYNGYYSGTIYKDMQTPYVDPFVTTHTKYAIYITDSDVKNTSNLNTIVNNNDVDVILIGNAASEGLIAHDYFILNDGSSIEGLVNKALAWVVTQNPVPEEDVLTTQNTPFNMSESDYDEEGDLLINKGFQYVHNKDYYDNPTGLEAGTQINYSETADWTTTKKTSFANVGLYTIYRKIQDQPSTDPNFASYSKTSNIPYLKVAVHRIPISQPVMSWKYNTTTSLYELTFTDNSYDLDHQFSRADKGIIETSVRYRKDAGDWNYKIPTDLVWGNYQIEYYVKDVEQAWSAPLVINANLLQVPSANITIESEAIPKDINMRGDTTMPAGEILQVTSPDHASGPIIHSNIPITSAQMLVDGVVKGTLALTLVPSETEYLYNTNIVEYTVPANKTDSNMTVTVRATSNVGNQSKDKVQTVGVYSPIWEDYSSGRLVLISDALVGVPSSMELSATTAHEKMVDFGIKSSKYTSKLKISVGGITYYLFKNGTVSRSSTSTGLTAITTNTSTQKYKITNIVVTADGFNRIWKYKFSIVNNYPLKYNTAATFSVTGYDEFGSATTTLNKHSFNPRTTVIVPNNYQLSNFKVVKIRELNLENYYYNPATGNYDDRPIGINQMAIDGGNFGIDGLTKGYKFEFEIDSKNFNAATDTIIIEPHFYTADAFTRDSTERDLYWEDSNHIVYKVGEVGHAAWKTIILTNSERTVKSGEEALWRGEYLIPGTTWAVPKGTTKAQAKDKDLKRDIIVNFSIKGYKNGVLQYDYNLDQWPKERTNTKYPYQVGDVIRYSWNKSCLDDIESKDNR